METKPMKHQPREYTWIEKWGLSLGSFRHYILAEQQRAAEAGAPLNAISYNDRTKQWSTTDDIKSNDARSRLGLPLLPPAPSSYEALVKFDAAKAPPGFSLPDPEMPETSNQRRAEAAAKGLAAYAAITHQEDEDIETTVQDFLTDLRHFCDGHGFDFAWLCDRGYGNYVHEHHLSHDGKEDG